MGKVLQIRVSAVTWAEDLMEKFWPQLYALAFSVPIKHDKRGVLEMVYALGDGMQFMQWSEARRTALKPYIEQAVDTARCLENALANWDPRTANSLSDTLEQILDDMEKHYVY